MKTRFQQMFFALTILLLGFSLFAGLSIKPILVLPTSDKFNDFEFPWNDTIEVIENIAEGKFLVWNKSVPNTDDEQWDFDVFTPPRIYINPISGVFESTAYQYQDRKSIPTIEIIDVKKEPFRFQLNGFVETNVYDASQSTLLLYDSHQGGTLRIPFREGVKLNDGSTLGSFTVEHSLQENGGIRIEGVLIVNRLGLDQIELRSSETTYTSRLLIHLRLNGDSHHLNSNHFQVVTDSHKVEWIESESILPLLVFHVTNLSSMEVHQIQLITSSQNLHSTTSYE